MQKTTALSAIILGVFVCILTLTTVDNTPIIQASGMGWLTNTTFPYLAGTGLILFGFGLLMQVRKKSVPEEKVDIPKSAFRNIPILLAIIVIYVSFIDTFGYIIMTMLFVGTMSLYFGVKKPLTLILLVVGVTMVTYYVFGKLLMVPLPGI